jgi:hypothetical protein
MALDTNIALGVKPIEQPNMLAQMGQMMQLRGAQQQYEQQNNLRDAFAQGTDINDPATFDRIARQDPRLALELRGKGLDQQQKQTEVGLKRAEYLGAAFGGLVKNPTLDNAYSIFDTAVQMGILPSQAAAAMRAKLDATGGDPRQIAALAQQGIDSAIDAKAKMQDATSRYSTNVAAGTAANRLQFDRDRDTREQEQLKAALRIVLPGRTSSATSMPINMGGTTTATAPLVTGNAPMSGGQLGSGTFNIPMGGAQTPLAGAVGQPNTLATQVAPQTQTDVNAFNRGTQKEQIVSQISQLANLPTIAGSRLLENKIKEYNVLYPTEKIEQDRQGNLITVVNGVAKPVVGLTGLPIQGKPLAETSFETTVRKAAGDDAVKVVKIAQAAPKNIAKIDEALGILKSGGAVTGFGAEIRLNLERAMSLFANDIKAGKRVADTQILDALLGSDVFPSLQSMGLGSKNIDTPAEREYLRQVITGTITMDNDALIRLTQIRRNVEVNGIKDYNQKIKSGKLNNYFKATDQTPEEIEIPNTIIRRGTHKNGRSVIEYADGTVEYGN